jgi:phosphatidylserine synthase
MDNKRLGGAATIAAVGIATILAINQVQGWEMPDWLAVSLLVAAAVMVFIAILVAAFEVRKWLKQLVDP